MTELAKNVSSYMGEKESVKAFIEGSKKFSMAARELARMSRDVEWEHVAVTTELMAENVYKLSRMKAMTRTEQLQAVNLKQTAGLV